MVARRLLPLLALVAMIFASLAMVGGSAALAQPSSPAPSSHHERGAGDQAHCAEMSGQSETQDGGSRQGDCVSDCAVTCSAIPPLGSLLAGSAMVPAVVHPLPLVDRMHGMNPESADPPPRTA